MIASVVPQVGEFVVFSAVGAQFEPCVSVSADSALRQPQCGDQPRQARDHKHLHTG